MLNARCNLDFFVYARLCVLLFLIMVLPFSHFLIHSDSAVVLKTKGQVFQHDQFNMADRTADQDTLSFFFLAVTSLFALQIRLAQFQWLSSV